MTGSSPAAAPLLTWALDLDGVVWLAGRAIPGQPKPFRAALSGRTSGVPDEQLGARVAAHVEALAQVGIDCQPDDLTTSAQAAASLLPPGSRAAVIGGAGIREALEAQGVKEVGADESPDAVVVGRTVELDYWAFSAAASAIRGGARFVLPTRTPLFP